MLHEPFSASAKYSLSLLIVASNCCRSICNITKWVSLSSNGMSQTQKNVFAIDNIYSAFQFGWESRLEFDRCAITVISLNEHFHISWLQCWSTWLRHDVWIIWWSVNTKHESAKFFFLVISLSAPKSYSFFFSLLKH